MNRPVGSPAFVLVTFAVALAGGCATTSHDGTVAPDPKFAVVQVGQMSAKEFVACVDCPPRTQKVIALPEPAVARPTVEPPKPQPPAARKPAPKAFSVHFRFGRHTLDKAGREELAAALAAAKVKGSAVTILGRTDPVGTLPFNQRLALRRADTVRKGLVAAGVPASAIRSGAHEPCCDGDKAARAAVHRVLRRADVRIIVTTPTP